MPQMQVLEKERDPRNERVEDSRFPQRIRRQPSTKRNGRHRKHNSKRNQRYPYHNQRLLFQTLRRENQGNVERVAGQVVAIGLDTELYGFRERAGEAG